jgi:hypothetical protein
MFGQFDSLVREAAQQHRTLEDSETAREPRDGAEGRWQGIADRAKKHLYLPARQSALSVLLSLLL